MVVGAFSSLTSSLCVSGCLLHEGHPVLNASWVTLWITSKSEDNSEYRHSWRCVQCVHSERPTTAHAQIPFCKMKYRCALLTHYKVFRCSVTVRHNPSFFNSCFVWKIVSYCCESSQLSLAESWAHHSMLYTPAAKKDKKQEDLEGLAEANNTPEIGKDKSTVKKLSLLYIRA